MERLLSIEDLAERWQCSKQTVRRRMEEMPHMEKPRMAYERDVLQWERSRMVMPAAVIRAAARAKRRRA